MNNEAELNRMHFRINKVRELADHSPHMLYTQDEVANLFRSQRLALLSEVEREAQFNPDCQGCKHNSELLAKLKERYKG